MKGEFVLPVFWTRL